MAVVIETTLGDITVDLYLDQRPVTCLNFLKLCKMKYYNYNLFHTIRSGFIAQTGDPTGEGSGGQSIFGIIEGPQKRFFSGEKMPKIRHTDVGLLSMVGTGDMMIGSQFFFTLGSDLDSLDGIHCVIGEVTEGHDILRKLNDVICDETHRPYQDVRITHTVILEDPFNDPSRLHVPSRSPSPNAERLQGGRIAPDEEINEMQGKSAAEVQEMIEEKEAKARATILEIVGDIPDADIAPPENVLFVCKLNPVTSDEDLEIIFSRFGKIVSCEVIRDKKTGDSLQYAFIEFSDKKSCEDAYFKMDNVLIDDRRIHVDFSQSVSKMKWLGKGRGVKYFDETDEKTKNVNNSKIKRSDSRDRDKNNHKRYSDGDKRHAKGDKDQNRHRAKEERYNKHERTSRSDKHHREKSRSKERSSKKESSVHDRQHNEKKSTKDTSSNKNSYSDRESNDSHRRDKTNSKSKDSSSHKLNSSPITNKKTHTMHNKKNNGHKENCEKKENKHENYSSYDHKKISVKDTKTLNSNSAKEIAEPRTPSPIVKKIRDKSNSKNLKNKDTIKTSRNNRKRRKPSTSSDSDSSDSSSSSSDSTSSSDRGKKKRALKRKKKKYSTSSSSTDSSDSSTSSSSSSESSTSSSSSSDSEPNKKKKVSRKIIAKNSKKKS